MNEVRRLALLIEQANLMEWVAQSLQIDNGSDLIDLQVDKFGQHYPEWFEDCLPLLPPDLHERFEYQFLGLPARPRISAFIGELPNYQALIRGLKGRVEYQEGLDRWNRIVRDHFVSPLRIQVSLLRDAQDLAAPLAGLDLHPRVRLASGRLFRDGDYRLAVFEACLALSEEVRTKSGSSLDGVALMNKVFSTNSPVLKFTDHPDEQQGFMSLFVGMVMALRNPRAHSPSHGANVSRNEAREILAFISFLFRSLDRSTQRVDQTRGPVR